MPTPASNVVALSKEGRGAKTGSQNRTSVIIRECREKISERLAGQLPAMMDQVDDSLFEIAEKSDTNTTQAVYFEAMREIRLKRALMEELFSQNFLDSSKAKESKARDSHPDFQLPDPPELSLGLVDNDDVEESLAVTNMVSKIKTQCKENLFAFDRRIALLLNCPDLKADDNPLGAKTICNAFKDACDELDVPLEVKLIVLKLFDKFVVSQAEAIYFELNEFLIAKDVLPKIRQEIRRHPDQRPAPKVPGVSAGVVAPAGGVSAPPQVGGYPVHGGVVGPGVTPAGLPSGTNVRVATEGGVVAGTSLPQAPGQALHSGNPVERLVHEMMADFGVPESDYTATYDAPSHQVVMQSLTSLQQGGENAVQGVDHTVVGTGMVNVLHDIKASPVAGQLNQVDNIMIDVVAMMFDFIFDDNNIPPSMKALIGRLQIPVLKVAIIDKTFFSSRAHPVRKLLNTLGGAAMQWNRVKERNDRLLKKVEQLVERVLNEFSDDVEVFADVLEELEAALAADRNDRTARVNDQAKALQRTEQLRQAGSKAEEEISKRLGKPNLLAFVRDFLNQHWREFLTLTYMKEGAAGDGWRAGLDTMDDLLWSIAPKPIAEDRARLSSLLPRLLERLKKGTSQIAMASDERRDFLQRLSRIHIDVVTRGQAAPPVEEEVVAAEPALEDAEDADTEASTPDATESAATDYLEQAVRLTNQAVFETAASRSQCKGMGTTIVAGKFQDAELLYTHVGDSRLYRFRQNRLTQLTRDHSLRQDVIEKGYFTPEEAAERVPGHILSRAIGGEEEVLVDIETTPTETGDLYLLCSDGLSDLVDPSAMVQALLESESDLDAQAKALIDLANEAGGRDNITVILAQVTDTDVNYCGLTDVGRRRAHNEDDYAIDSEHGVVVLADGMGGCKAGEVASHIATGIMLACMKHSCAESVREKLSQTDNPDTLDADAIHALFTAEDGLSAFLESMPDETSQAEGLFDELAEDCSVEESELSEDLFGASEPHAVLDGATRQVMDLKVGAWVEFNANKSSPVRAHLSWISPVSGIYLFTDRRGQKVADPNQHGLIAEVRTGDVKILSDVPLFDRLMGHMSSHLRERTVADYDEHSLA